MNITKRQWIIRKPIAQQWRVLATTLSIVFLSVIYEWIAYRAHISNPNTTTMPYFSDILKAFSRTCLPDRYGDIWMLKDMSITLLRLTSGLIVSCFLAIIVGILIGCFEFMESIWKPYLSTASMIPATAMMAVFFLLVGTKFPFYVSIIAFGVVPVLSLSIYSMVKYDIPSELIDKAYTLGASLPEVIWEVVLPMLRPRILDAIRVMFGPALLVLIAGEYQLADVGVGYRMRMQMRSLDMSVIYNYIIVLCVIGFLNDFLILKIRKSWCPWYTER